MRLMSTANITNMKYERLAVSYTLTPKPDGPRQRVHVQNPGLQIIHYMYFMNIATHRQNIYISYYMSLSSAAQRDPPDGELS